MGHRRLVLLFLIVFIATTHAAAGHGQAAAITQQQGSMGVGSMMRTMVGSRPPICAGRCWWCGGRRCEAVQVPVTPQDLQRINNKGRRHGSISSASAGGRGASHSHSSLHPSSYDDHSNYKPLSWRCKCGEIIFNP